MCLLSKIREEIFFWKDPKKVAQKEAPETDKKESLLLLESANEQSFKAVVVAVAGAEVALVDQLQNNFFRNNFIGLIGFMVNLGSQK